MRLRTDELIVDNFAGGGGASHGIFMATGRHPDIAINHDQEAIAMHRANHPETLHLCEDVFAIDPIKVCNGRPVGLAWFSPDCKHFSKAKGGKPVSKKIRGLAWVVVKWAAAVKPRIIALENVEEFQTWGPIDKDGKPRKDKQGVTFRFWWRKLEKLGYRIEMKELRACDYGAPTIRKRLFIIARCDGLPIEWPKATHADPKSEAVKSGRLKPWRTAAECIDWSLACPSIFERERPLAENTLKRIARGIQRYVIDAKEPFIVTCNHGGDWFRGHGTSEPMNTLTAARDAHGLVMPYISRMDQTSGADRNGIAPPDEPLRTVHAVNPFAVVSPVLTGVGGRAGQSRPRSGDEPMQTITAKGDTGLVVPTLIQTGYGEREGQAPRVPGLDKPLGTAVGSNKHALVSAFLTKFRTGATGSSMEEPVHTITAGPKENPAGAPHAMGIVTSHLLKLKGTCQHGQETGKPMPTIQAGGLHVGNVQAFLIKYYSNGCGKTGASLNKPAPTIPAHDRVGLVTVHGEEYQIVDIGLRMLQPRELYRAQGFPDSYEIELGMDADGNPDKLSKSAQVRMCGNSVCPPLAAAIVAAQLVVTQQTDSRPNRPAKQMGLI